MTFAILALALTVGVTLGSTRPARTKGVIIALATLLVTGALTSEAVAPASAWSRILSGLTMVLA